MIKSELFYDDDRGALFEDGKLVEYWPASQDDYHIGAICILRITQIFKKQKRAQCQLPNGALVSFRLTDAKGLSVGSFCWITLTAQPRQHKPWQAEQGISRAGKYIVLHYGASGLRISHKAKGNIDTKWLDEVKTHLPDGWGGVLKRASAGVSAEDIVAEIKLLTKGIDLPPPASITEPKIIYNGDSGYDLYCLAAAPHTILQQQSDNVFWQEIEEQVAEACSQNITLPSGARLSFELTQALTAVDVDSATSQLAPAALAKHVAPEIMRFIRLACYSGIIIVDMPRMGTKDIAEVLEVMRSCATKDMRHPDVLGVSRAGLIEIVVRHRLAYLGDRVSF